VPHVLERWVVLEMVGHHGVLWGGMGISRGRAHHHVDVFVVIVVHVLLPHEILGAFVLVRSAIILIATDGLVDVARGELVQLLVVAEDDDGNIDRAENGELVGLLEEAAFALQKGDGAVPVVLDGLDLDLSAAHGGWRWSYRAGRMEVGDGQRRDGGVWLAARAVENEGGSDGSRREAAARFRGRVPAETGIVGSEA
jgi:hypothetical protein